MRTDTQQQNDGTQALAADEEQLRRRVEELGPWFHNLRLGSVQTAPNHFLGDYPEMKFRHFRDALPADLRGKSVLDIGCNAGFYSFEMKRRAARIACLASTPTTSGRRSSRLASQKPT